MSQQPEPQRRNTLVRSAKTTGKVAGKTLHITLKQLAVTMPTLAVMTNFPSVWQPPRDAVVFATMTSLSLPRLVGRTPVRRWLPMVAGLGVGACLAVGCAMLLGIGQSASAGRSTLGPIMVQALGALLFSVCVAAPIWARRFGASWTLIGSAVSIPFFAALMVPIPLSPSWSMLGWMLGALLITLAWATLIAGKNYTLRRLIHSWRTRHAGASSTAATERSSTRQAPTQALRQGSKPWPMPASSKMALQLFVATASAFALSLWLLPAHYAWVVLTVLVVHSGNRGRGDVLLKGIQRTLGAMAGMAAATIAAATFAPGDKAAVVALVGLLIVGIVLRPYGYIYWAGAVSAALAFLYAFEGESGTDMLLTRLIAIIAGGLIGIASAWCILPVRSIDVARRRVGAVLREATNAAAAAAKGTLQDTDIAALRAATSDLDPLLATATWGRHLRTTSMRHIHSALVAAKAFGEHLAKDLEAQIAGTETHQAPSRKEFGTLAKALGPVRKSLQAPQPQATQAQQPQTPEHQPETPTNPPSPTRWEQHLARIASAKLGQRSAP